MADDQHAIPSRTDYTVNKGEVSLAVYRKRIGSALGQSPCPVLFLVHGSSNSGLSSFDLTVPGASEYSTMNVFARLGFDVWTMDHENYGRSSRTSGNSDIASGVEDLIAATELVIRETGRERLHFMGESSGALRAAAFATVRPERVDRLVLNAFTYTGRGSPTLAKRAEQLDYFLTHNRRPRDRAMIRSIFTRDHPGTSDPAVAEALADAELVFCEEVPTGTYLDMTANLPVVDPLKLQAPVMIVRGEHDGIASGKICSTSSASCPTRIASLLSSRARRTHSSLATTGISCGTSCRLSYQCRRDTIVEAPRLGLRKKRGSINRPLVGPEK
jgi:pimeloyl-ACP methyl ester carboxylesterase